MTYDQFLLALCLGGRQEGKVRHVWRESPP